jgi:hypothetical protein
METHTNEQEVKRPSLFLKPTNGSVVTIKSHLVSLKSHYIEAAKKSVLCSSDDCVLCAKGEKQNIEYYYWGTLGDGEHDTTGPIQLPGSVFFAMNKAEGLLKKDKRSFMWIISKEGEGRQTKYSVINGDSVTPLSEEDTKANTDRLERVLTKYEDTLTQKLREYLFSQPQESKPSPKKDSPVGKAA